MKALLCLFFTIAGWHNISAQYKVQPVNWKTPACFTAERLDITTEHLSINCRACRIMELETEQGVTGLYISGDGTMSLKDGNISDEFSVCLFRFNPEEYTKWVNIVKRHKLKDRGFYEQAIQICKDLFRHSYHSGMDALIPKEQGYSAAFYAKENGDLLASYTPEEIVILRFSDKKILYRIKAE